MMNVKILVATHKKYKMPENKIYVPIHVGAENKADIGYIRDDAGENISNKNKNYCELTALYWAWKNIECEYIGLCHYRRYFNLSEKVNRNIEKQFININCFEEYMSKNFDFMNILNNYDIILPTKRIYPISVKQQYNIKHNKKDLEILREVISEKYESYLECFEKYMSGNQSHLYNMFLMKKKDYDQYCKWLFEILFEVERRIEISTDSYQARVLGFMSERLLNVYILKNKYKVKEVPIVYFGDKKMTRYKAVKAKRKINNLVFNLFNFKK